VRLGSKVHANPISPILHWRCNGDLAIAANGRSIAVPYDREIVRMLGRVSRGTCCEVADLLRARGRKSERLSRQRLRRALKFLLEESALETV
jgi:hypothetical protein